MSDTWYSDHDELLSVLRETEGAVAKAEPPTIEGFSDLVELSAGGQGVVYSAVQDAAKRRVAIKLLRPDARRDELALRRFEREIELVAQLRHPNIVRLYDSGTTQDGHLYFVMDFIEGVALDEHLRTLREASNPDALDQLLQLFRTIAQALTHAHQRGVIHRDLKPSNIRVDRDGAPHVLDFGLAKPMSSQHAPGVTITGGSSSFMGSLPWASPEQAAGDPRRIDTRTDLYSLGVMLYQAITGEFPYDVSGSLREALDAIEHTPPPPFRELPRPIPRELETVVRTCLEKAPDDRYQSASAIAEDLRRIIDGEPILATSASTWKAMRRSVKRYRSAATFGLIALVGLAGLAGVMTYLYSRALVAESKAADEQRRAVVVNTFLLDMLASPNPSELGRDVSLREMLAVANKDLDADTQLLPLDKAALHEVMSRTHHALGEYDLAAQHARSAIQLFSDASGADAPHTIEATNLLATALIGASKFDEAASVISPALATARRTLGENHPTALSILSNLAAIHSEKGEYDQAIEIHRRVHASRAAQFGPAHPSTITSLHNLAVEESWAGRLDDSLEHYTLAAELCAQTHGDAHPETLLARGSLAVAIEKQGDARESAALLREVIPTATQVLGEDHRETNIMRSNLAFALTKLGEHDDALMLMREIFESSRRTLGDEHTDTINAANGLASALYHQGQLQEASALLQHAYESSLAVFGPLHVRSLDSGMNLVQVLRKIGDSDQASRVSEQTLARANEYYQGKLHHDLAWFTKVAADVRMDLGDAPGAVALYQKATEHVMLGNDTSLRISILRSLGAAHVAQNEPRLASAAYHSCAELMSESGYSPDEIASTRALAESLDAQSPQSPPGSAP